jgi:beta-mannosidase
MFRYFRFPKDFANFVYLSQIQQGLAIKTAVEYWRSLKPHCMGTIYWQLNDTWPVASWSSLDYGGSWKAMHYMVRRFFQPVTVAANPSDDGTNISLSMVNDTLDTVTIDANLFVLTLSGDRIPLKSVQGDCGPDAADVLVTLDASEIPADGLLAWSFIASNGMSGEGHFLNGTYKALELEPSRLETTVTPTVDGGFEITVSARGLALFVMLESPTAGRYSDNAFDLCAGESRRIIFTPNTALPAGALPEFRIYDLYTCQSAD